VRGPLLITATLARRAQRPFLAALIVGLLARWLYVYAAVDLRPLDDVLSYLLRGQYLAAQSTRPLMPIIGAHHRTYPHAYWPSSYPILLALLIKLRTLPVALWVGQDPSGPGPRLWFEGSYNTVRRYVEPSWPKRPITNIGTLDAARRHARDFRSRRNPGASSDQCSSRTKDRRDACALVAASVGW
jgi:hypothetical protein